MGTEENAQNVVGIGLNPKFQSNVLDCLHQYKNMNFDPEKIAENFLELSSEQRLKIIFNLLQKSYNISNMAKELEATSPEVHRNFTRMLKVGLVEKDSDGNFHLSTFGKTICAQIPSIVFVSENKKFFENHNFGNIPEKFIHRIGELSEGKHIKGFVKVLEKWKQIHDNAEKYIYNVLSEVPYSKDIIDVVENKLKNNIKICSIFAQNAIIPDERKMVFKIKGFDKYIKDGWLERKMIKSISVVTLLNEKEACMIFPKNNGEPDMSELFYSPDPHFHEWCLDYFNHCWECSSSFQEDKLQ